METPMTDRISLTAAEAAFLIASRGADASSPVSRVLGLTDADFDEQVRASGLASLVLRRLAVPVADRQVRLAPPVLATAEALTEYRTVVQIALVAAEGVESSIVVDAPHVRLVAAPRPHRCVEVTGLDRDADLRQILARVAEAFLSRYKPAVATFSAVPAGVSASLAVDRDGRWRFIEGADTDGAVIVDEPAEALRMLVDAVGAPVPQSEVP
jgi:hypothetical protein